MAYRADDPAPLLPASVRTRLQGGLWKLLGFLVLAACAALSASLLTWSAADPSLTRATSGGARNLLGPPGAILSDMLMQMLGLAGVFVLLPPLFWALRLLTAQPPSGLRGKMVLAPLAVLFLAGALSALPSASAWPLHHHGYGGVLGDLGLGLLASLLAHVNADRSAAAAGLFYFAAGLTMLMSSLGLSRQELRLICQTDVRPTLQPGLRAMAGWWRELCGRTASIRLPAPRSVAPDPVREPPVLHLERPLAVEPDAPEPADDEDDIPNTGRDASFDRLTDHTSQAIARRFAPASSESQLPAGERPTPTLGGPPFGESALDPSPVAERAPRGETACRRPPLGLLRRSPAAKGGALLTQAELRGQARLLGDVLADFGVNGEVRDVHPGPVVTLYEFEPARGVKSARVIGLADDLARSMGAACVRAAAIPGRNAIGIELPNPRREKVLLRELLDSEAFRATKATLPLALGKNISGTPVFADLARMPHLLVAGTTGSGKSVGVNAMILSLLYRLSPDQCRLLMIDPKMLELSVYNGIPHLLCPVVTEPTKAVAALNWVVAEMESRYRRMSLLAVRNIDAFNNRVRQSQAGAGRGSVAAAGADLAPMPYIVVVVDEFADLMLVAGKEIEAAVQRLAQMARAAGIHLIMATQRPSVDIVTGTIKANFPTRISYKVASKFDSRTIINEQGAEQLLGEGDMLFSNGAGQTLRVHGPFVADEEVERIAAYLRDQGEPRYVDGITDVAEEEAESGGKRVRPVENDLYDRAVEIVVNERKASTSYLQRRLTIGYNRAADLMERMERDSVVSPAGFGGRRQILLREDAQQGG
jgi:DNA segregation ATPase FtsK/SpoIIIE, S-DNA-T family